MQILYIYYKIYFQVFCAIYCFTFDTVDEALCSTI